DVLVIYTDGVTETRDDSGASEDDLGEEYGVERLIEVTREHQHRTAEEILDAVFEDVRAFSGGAPTEDDRTAIVIRCPPGA
ncbi:MAG: SpoIIE family protein phosphatase, partial [Acidobacteriota bacterium]